MDYGQGCWLYWFSYLEQYLSGTGDKMGNRIDKILNDIQIKLVELTNEIQKQREFLKKANGTRKEKKEANLQRVAEDLSRVFKDLGYETSN